MHDLSTDELRALAERYDVDLKDGESSEVRDLVQQLLRGVERVTEVPLPGSPRHESSRRSWREPEENAGNWMITATDVADDGADGLLSGISVGVKDVIAVAGVPMTGGSKALYGHVPSEDATVVRRLLEQGATITAKTNCDELATSGRGTTSAFGRISNPHDDTRTAGGSSGGSAVAVATGRTDVALGTDTSGSVQLPASLCGTVGLKPTYGLVPLSGVVEHAYSMDHVAFFSTTIDQQARLLEATAGKETTDASTLQAAGRDEYRVGGYAAAVQNPPELDSLTFGLVEEGLGAGVEEYVADHVLAAMDGLADAGATVRRVSIDHFEYARAINENISYTELASHWRAGAAPHRRGGGADELSQQSLSSSLRGRSGQLGPYYKSKLLAGAQLIEDERSRFYTRAQGVRETLRGEFESALRGVDALVYPTAPAVAPKLDDVDRTALDFARNTRQATVTRLPAITLPTGTHEGLPLGTEFVGGPFRERTLLRIASGVEGQFEGHC